MAAVGRESSGHEKQHYSWSQTPSTATDDRARRKLSGPCLGLACLLTMGPLGVRGCRDAVRSFGRRGTAQHQDFHWQSDDGGSFALLHVNRLPAHLDVAPHPSFLQERSSQ